MNVSLGAAHDYLNKWATICIIYLRTRLRWASVNDADCGGAMAIIGINDDGQALHRPRWQLMRLFLQSHGVMYSTWLLLTEQPRVIIRRASTGMRHRYIFATRR